VQRDVDVLEIRRERRGPGIAGPSWGAEQVTGRAAPALACERPERGRGRTAHGDLHVVERAIPASRRIDPCRLVDAVVRCVPAIRREVEAAEERDRVVDHHELLVVTGAERVLTVETELQAAVRPPSELDRGEKLALEREYERVVPVEQAGAQTTLTLEHGVQELPQRRRQAVRHALRGLELRRGLDVPADDHDRLARAGHGLHERAKIGVGVDQDRKPRRAHAAPRVPPLDADRAAPPARPLPGRSDRPALCGHPRSRGAASPAASGVQTARTVPCTRMPGRRTRRGIPTRAVHLTAFSFRARRAEWPSSGGDVPAPDVHREEFAWSPAR